MSYSAFRWAATTLTGLNGRAQTLVSRVMCTASSGVPDMERAESACPTSGVSTTRLSCKGQRKQNVMTGVRHLAAVYLLEAVVTLSAFWGGQWMSRMYGTSRPDVWEIFGGHAEISVQAWRQGWLAMQPIDKIYGADLLQQEQRREVLDCQRKLQPRLIVIQFPCTYWTSLTRINYRTPSRRQKLKQLRQQHMFFLTLCEQLSQ